MAWKVPVSQRNPAARTALHKIFIELARLLGRSGLIERRTLAAAHISVQRELRDHQHAAFGFTQGQVHFSAGVLENSQACNFVREIVGVGFCILFRDPEQDEQAVTNVTDKLVAYGHAGVGHSLHYGSHGLFRRR